MKKLLLSVMTVAICGAGFGTAQAMTLGERQQMATWQQGIENGYGDFFEEKCGYRLDVTLDSSMIAPFMAEHTSAAAYCEAPLSRMAHMCDNAMNKEAITAQIKGLVCTYSAAEGDLGFSLSEDGILIMVTKPGDVNLDDKALKFLNENL